MRNPNRFGTCYKLSGKRRKPFIARAYMGKKDGKPIYKTIGYFRTKSEGQQALLNYKYNPYNIDVKHMTLTEVFEKFKEEKESEVKDFNMSYGIQFRKLEPLHHFEFKDIKAYMFQNVLNDLSKQYSKGYVVAVKTCIKQLVHYAIKLEIIEHDYSVVLKAKGKEQKEQSVFTVDEVSKIISSMGKVKNVESIVFMLFTGCRPSEMLNVRLENIDLEHNIIHSFGVKTKTSKNKRVPIPDILKEYIVDRVENGHYYLFPTVNGYRNPYASYINEYKQMLQTIGIEYKTPKSCRHFFATVTNNENINDKTRQAILGHSDVRTTNDFYTHIEDKKINDEYEKIERVIRNITNN